jgi:hypothetical protein
MEHQLTLPNPQTTDQNPPLASISASAAPPNPSSKPPFPHNKVILIVLGSFLLLTLITYLTLPKTYDQCRNFPLSWYDKSDVGCTTFYGQKFKNTTPTAFNGLMPTAQDTHPQESPDTTTANGRTYTHPLGFSFQHDSSIQVTQTQLDTYPHIMVQANSLDQYEDAPGGFTLQNALADQQALAENKLADIGIDWPVKSSEKLTPLTAQINAREFLVLSRFDACDVTFERKLIFYHQNHQIILSYIGDPQLITTAPSYSTTHEENCGSSPIWDFDSNAQSRLATALTTTTAPPEIQTWYDSFNFILSTFNTITTSNWTQYNFTNIGFSLKLPPNWMIYPENATSSDFADCTNIPECSSFGFIAGLKSKILTPTSSQVDRQAIIGNLQGILRCGIGGTLLTSENNTLSNIIIDGIPIKTLTTPINLQDQLFRSEAEIPLRKPQIPLYCHYDEKQTVDTYNLILSTIKFTE